ncbi:MAG TPA: HD domain-containing protein [Candidatus Wallbacteria bacterium]|nr:HD domain-containing protein [Candidatus Wallbacteria bacterium]
MKKDLFSKVGIFKQNPKWEACISRERKLYLRDNEVRSEFARDYTRIIHCGAYRRLKHKTQVFPATQNDHICTRIEHVTHVASVSNTISLFLGLNAELTAAIATGHDLGHAPFGHSGEALLSKISQAETGDRFWHEQNGLRSVDIIETLAGPDGKECNLDLTYAVRDGIISHCGEVNENALFPREEPVDLNLIEKPNQYLPFTWEGCIVKIADKISYLGRDIEDALLLNILSVGQIKELKKILKDTVRINKVSELNNTVLMHDFIKDLCVSSSPENGIRFSEKYLDLINLVKAFNYKNIYFHKRLSNYIKYAELVINSIFGVLKEFYSESDPLGEMKKYEKFYPSLTRSFTEWILKYSDLRNNNNDAVLCAQIDKYENRILYKIRERKDFIRCVIQYISCMTDHFAIGVFNEMTSF